MLRVLRAALLRAAVLLGSVALLWPSAASADSPRVELRWQDETSREALGCITARALTERVEQVLGRVVHDDDAPAVLTVDASPTATGFLATLTLSTRAGEVLGVRVIEQDGSECRVLDGPLVVVSAMLTDLRELESRLSFRGEQPAPEPTDEQTQVGIWLAGEAAWMLLPELSGGAALGVWIRVPGFWPIELTVSLHPETGTHADIGATFLSFIGSLSLCGPIDQPGWELRICGGASVGLAHGVGRGFESARDEVRPYVDLRAVAEIEIEIAAPLWVLVRIGAAAPLLRTEFVGLVGGEERTLHSYGYVVPFGDVGLGMHF